MSATVGGSIAVLNTEFLEEIFADMPDDAAAMLCGFAGDPNDETGDRRWKWMARAWTHGIKLPANVGPEANNYVAISSFGRNEAGEYRRRKDQFKRLHTVMIDDVNTKVSVARLRIPPSARIETSPNNFQDFLFIETTAAADDAIIAARLIEQLVAKGLTADGKDPGMTGVTRVGRLPVGVNGKTKYVQALGHPFRTRMVEWAPQRRYTVEHIAHTYALDLTPPKSRVFTPLPDGAIATRQTAFNNLMQTLADAGLYMQSHGEWHDIVCPWWDQHSDRSLTGTAIREPNAENRWNGGFVCHHGHCKERTIRHVYQLAREMRQAVKA